MRVDPFYPFSGVQPEGLAAFCAPKELGGPLVTRSRLYLPGVGQVVAALWTDGFYRGRCPQPLLVSPDYNYVLTEIAVGNLLNGHGLGIGPPFETATATGKAGPCTAQSQDQSCSAGGTKFHS